MTMNIIKVYIVKAIISVRGEMCPRFLLQLNTF